MNDVEAIALAKAALSAWDVPDQTPQLINNRENAVFEVSALGGARAALRLHRPGYQSDASIRSEMIWSLGLSNAGMAVPCPIAARNGDVIAKISGSARVSSMVTWVEGVPLGADGVCLCWSDSEQLDLFHAIGAELLKLHQISDALILPEEFERPVLDVDGLLGDAPLWGNFWENAALTKGNSELLQGTRRALQGLFSKHLVEGGSFGLIHADALRENILVQNSTPVLIDFDDGGFGFRLYDLGVAMAQNWELPNAAELASALTEGYGLTNEQARLLPAFTTMRALASCGWVISRYPPDSPQVEHYAGRAVRAATRFMDGTVLSGA